MALTILNNISALTAENALSNTQASLQKTLTQLSTGLQINSGSDNPAGLSIAEGMTANIAALNQSQQNATNGVGLLQTADGALSQVTTLLNRAVTLATEGSTSGITGSQATALDTEFQSILKEINQVGQTTNFNGQNVFAGNTGTAFETTAGSTATPLALTSTLAANSVTTISDGTNGDQFSFTANAAGTSTIGDLNTAIATAVTAGTFTATAFSVGAVVQGTAGTQAADTNNLELAATNGDALTVTTSDNTTLQTLNAYAGATDNSNVFISDGSTVSRFPPLALVVREHLVRQLNLGWLHRLECCFDGGVHWDRPATLVLGVLQPHFPSHEVNLIPSQFILFAQPHARPQADVQLREVHGIDDRSHRLLLVVSEPTNDIIVLMLLAHQPRRVARHLAITQRLTEDQRE